MRTTDNRRKNPCCMALVIALLALAPVAVLSQAAGEAAGGEGSIKETGIQGIRIVTDEAIMDSQARQTEFKGNVAVDIDDTTIFADWMKVGFKDGVGDAPAFSMDMNAISEILARGNVRILFDGKTAVADEAAYDPANDTLTLTGSTVKITMDKGFMTGEKIVLNRKNGTFQAKSSGEQRVSLEFFQEMPERE